MNSADNRAIADAVSVAGVPERVVRVLRLFAEELAAVEFPGTSRQTLELCATAMLKVSARAAEARAALTAAERELAEHAVALERATERGLAYARVYAEEDAQVREALRAWGESSSGAGTELGGGAPRSGRTRRDRRKAETTAAPDSEQLALAGEPSTPDGATARLDR